MGAYSGFSRAGRGDAQAGTARRSAGAVAIRALVWLIFVGGVAGAVFGVIGLRVLVTVVALIPACTAGLVLLEWRADAGKPV